MPAAVDAGPPLLLDTVEDTRNDPLYVDMDQVDDDPTSDMSVVPPVVQRTTMSRLANMMKVSA